jgi:hypothetical protein
MPSVVRSASVATAAGVLRAIKKRGMATRSPTTPLRLSVSG